MRHEKTIVYERIISLLEVTRATIDTFPKGFSFLIDQLRRSAASVALNYAEGFYQASRKQQQRFFGYSIQSAREVSMAFDTARALGMADAEAVEEGRRLALEVVRILWKFDNGRRGERQVRG